MELCISPVFDKYRENPAKRPRCRLTENAEFRIYFITIYAILLSMIDRNMDHPERKNMSIVQETLSVMEYEK